MYAGEILFTCSVPAILGIAYFVGSRYGQMCRSGLLLLYLCYLPVIGWLFFVEGSVTYSECVVNSQRYLWPYYLPAWLLGVQLSPVVILLHHVAYTVIGIVLLMWRFMRGKS